MANTITYANKVALNENPDVADINKVKADDMNEIKSVVNNNAGETNTNATNITNLQTYSTSETNTGKIWIDGKPIYRKVVVKTVNSSSNAEYNLSDLGINNQDTIFIDLGKTTVHYGTVVGKGYSPAVYYINSSDRNHVYINGDAKLIIQNSTGSNRTFYITLEYTKTTD